MKTKAYVRFLNRIEHYAADVELVDVMARSVSNLSRNGKKIFDAVSPSSHPTLSKRGSSDGSRKIAIGHLKASIASAHLKDIYEDVTMYLRGLLTAAIRQGLNPGRLVGEHGFKTDANTVLQLGSWDAVVAYVSEGVFRSLEEEKSTMKLISKMDSKLDLGIETGAVEAALPYLEARHVLVHNDGIVDAGYAERYKALGLKKGDPLPTDYRFVLTARNTIGTLIKAIDALAVTKRVVGPQDMQP